MIWLRRLQQLQKSATQALVIARADEHGCIISSKMDLLRSMTSTLPSYHTAETPPPDYQYQSEKAYETTHRLAVTRPAACHVRECFEDEESQYTHSSDYYYTSADSFNDNSSDYDSTRYCSRALVSRSEMGGGARAARRKRKQRGRRI